MPTYVYQYRNGKTTEVWQSMRDDALVEIGGKPVTRIICAPQLMGLDTGRAKGDKYPYVSNSLPTTIKGAKMVRAKNKAGKFSRPKPLIESRKHEREVAAMNDLVRSEE